MLEVQRKGEARSLTPLCFFTLAVLQKVRVRAEEKLSLAARPSQLTLLYKNLIVAWIKDNVIVRRISINPQVRVRLLNNSKTILTSRVFVFSGTN
jgi:hypothetical protein